MNAEACATVPARPNGSRPTSLRAAARTRRIVCGSGAARRGLPSNRARAPSGTAGQASLSEDACPLSVVPNSVPRTVPARTVPRFSGPPPSAASTECCEAALVHGPELQCRVEGGFPMKVRRAVRNLGTTLAVGAVGAGVALLFAPQAGERTRRQIRRKAEDIGDGARNLYGRMIETGDGVARRLRYTWRTRLIQQSPAGH
jgi:YtxH-like protein